MSLLHRDFPLALKAKVWFVGVPLYGFHATRVVASALDEEFVAQAAVAYHAETGQKVGAFGDGTILKQILDWLSSPEGMAFIKFIFAMFGFMA